MNDNIIERIVSITTSTSGLTVQTNQTSQKLNIAPEVIRFDMVGDGSDHWIAVGPDPVATTDDYLLPAYAHIQLSLKPDDQVAVLGAIDNGILIVSYL